MLLVIKDGILWPIAAFLRGDVHTSTYDTAGKNIKAKRTHGQSAKTLRKSIFSLFGEAVNFSVLFCDKHQFFERTLYLASTGLSSGNL